MSSLRRYRLATTFFALTTAFAGYHAWHDDPGAGARGATRSAVTAKARKGDMAALRRPLRVNAAAVGLSEHALIDQLLAARTAQQVSIVADKLGLVGTDDAVAALAGLVDDPRPGVPESVIAAIGRIGTTRAVDLLLDLEGDARPRIRSAAVSGMASTGDARARKRLVAMARDRGDPLRATAIYALAEVGGDEVVKVLGSLARAGDYEAASAAVYALGQVSATDAQAMLVELARTGDTRIRALAVQNLQPQDDATIQLLTGMVKAGDPQVLAAALGALGKSGDPAVLPVLVSAAAGGPQYARWSAVTAIGEIGGEEAVAALGEILRKGDRNLAGQVAQMLVNLGGEDARDVLIEVALSEGPTSSMVIQALQQLRSPDVTTALVEIARHGRAADRRAVLPGLVKAGNEEAIALAIDLTERGTRQDRLDAIRMLGDTSAPEARAALVRIAESSSGQARTFALDVLAQATPDDPAVTQMLSDALFSGRADEASQAAWILGRLGNEDARSALLAALKGDDTALAQAALGALSQTGSAATVRAALVDLARTGKPGLRAQALGQLIHSGSVEGLQLAEQALAGGDPELARNAAWALQGLGSADAHRVLRQAVSSSDVGVRSAVAGALAQAGDDASIDALLQLTRDSDPGVKQQALSALGQTGSARAVDALVSASTAGDTGQRLAAVSSLGGVDDPRASQALSRLMDDRDEQVAAAAIWASYNGGDDVDRALLRAFGGTSSDTVRMAAAQQIRARGMEVDEATRKRLDDLLGDSGGYGYGGYGGYGYGGYYPHEPSYHGE